MKNSFDQARLSQLLKKAIGSRMQKDFADTIGISPAHLSRIINHKFDTPPSVDTLKRIAANAENNITYQELLSACGYIGESDFAEITLPQESLPASKFVKATILTALEANDYSFELISPPEASPYDLAVRINTAEHLTWYFQFLTQKSEEQMRRAFSANYLRLLFEKVEPTDKFSFVTCSRTEYEIYLDKLPENLNRNLSIILVNESQLDIQEEQVLARTIPYKNSVEQLLLSK